jgi:hypothetical protein
MNDNDRIDTEELTEEQLEENERMDSERTHVQLRVVKIFALEIPCSVCNQTSMIPNPDPEVLKRITVEQIDFECPQCKALLTAGKKLVELAPANVKLPGLPQ